MKHSALLQRSPASHVADNRGEHKQEIRNTSYVDDDTFFTIGMASDMIQKAKVLAETVHAGFINMGLSMNFDEFKCAAVFTFRGAGSKKARHKLHIEDKGCIPLQLLGGKTATLHAARRYVHLVASLSREAKCCRRSEPGRPRHEPRQHRAEKSAGQQGR